MRRIVVTGTGAVSPLGASVPVAWARLMDGQSGIRPLPDAIAKDLPVRIAGLVPDKTHDPEGGFDPDRFMDPKDQKRADRFIHFAMAAAQEALSQAHWSPSVETQKQRTATIIASGVGGFPAITETIRTVDTRGMRRLSPFTVPSFLVNLAAGQVSIRHGFRGPIGAPVTACAAALQAIGDAARLIRAGEADIALCGGAEACITTASLGGFAAARAMSTRWNDKPAMASRPFDASRDGFVMGEGAALLVIESLEHALARGAEPLAELVGYGTTADAYHLTSGPEDGEGARRAMELALLQAGLSPSEIGHLNAHATSTPVGDLGKLPAIRALFGTDSPPAVSATKSATSHLLGAAGGLAAIFTILALRAQLAPPTLNLEQRDPAADGLWLVGPKPERIATRYGLANGFGFGGVNASAIFGLY